MKKSIEKKINKFLYGWKLLVNYGYGHGWEYETFTESWQEFKRLRKDYMNNCPYPLKWVEAREANPEYMEAN